MDQTELKREQFKLASRVILQDTLRTIKTIGGARCQQVQNKLVASVVVLEFPSMNLLEKRSYVLDNPLPYMQGYRAYRELPALVEAFNMLDEEPDVLFVEGLGINHPRGIGLASHLGLVLNHPTIGVSSNLKFGNIEEGKIKINGEVKGFEIKTREHSNPIYVSPGYKVSLGTSLQVIHKSIKFPHKMPEPLHLARKIAKKKIKHENI